MRAPIRSAALTGLALLLAGSVNAQDLRDPAQNPLTAIRASRWADAQAAAARFADPVAEKLVLYFRLRAPDAATAAEIADFMQRNPDWPAQAMLEQRRQEAIAKDPDDADVLVQCAANSPGVAAPVAASPLSRPSTASAMLRCAEALANAGRGGDANETARQAWVATIDDPATETAFLHRWAGVASADDQWARFQRLAWTDAPGAARQITRLDHAHHAAAEARLAVKRDDPQAEPLVATLPSTLRDDPGLMLDRARAFRREDRPTDALAVWMKDGANAQNTAPDHVGEFWAERNVLARKLLQDGGRTGGSYTQAYQLVADHGQIAGEYCSTLNSLPASSPFACCMIRLGGHLTSRLSPLLLLPPSRRGARTTGSPAPLPRKGRTPNRNMPGPLRGLPPSTARSPRWPLAAVPAAPPERRRPRSRCWPVSAV